jgi:hypothetical protein
MRAVSNQLSRLASNQGLRLFSSVIVGDGVGDRVSGLAIESDLVFIIILLARFNPDSMSDDASHLFFSVLAWIPCDTKSKQEH